MVCKSPQHHISSIWLIASPPPELGVQIFSPESFNQWRPRQGRINTYKVFIYQTKPHEKYFLTDTKSRMRVSTVFESFQLEGVWSSRSTNSFEVCVRCMEPPKVFPRYQTSRWSGFNHTANTPIYYYILASRSENQNPSCKSKNIEHERGVQSRKRDIITTGRYFS